MPGSQEARDVARLKRDRTCVCIGTVCKGGPLFLDSVGGKETVTLPMPSSVSHLAVTLCNVRGVLFITSGEEGPRREQRGEAMLVLWHWEI